MKKLIFASIVLLIMMAGVVYAHDDANMTDLEAIPGPGDEILEVEINDDSVGGDDMPSGELIADDGLPADNREDKISPTLEKSNDEDNVLKANESANAIYISPTGTGQGLTADDPASWSYAIANIQDEGIIYFLDGEYLINEFVRNKQNLVFEAVNAGSAIINANHQNYALRTLGDRTKIIGLTFVNASNFAAVYSTDSLTIINSTFENNNANTNGGAVYSAKQINIINSTFSNNSAGRLGGAVYAGQNVNVENSNFIGNSASSGAAIYARQNAIVNSSKFQKNNASDQGGAINAFSNADVDNCEFTDNVAVGSGGAVRSDTLNCRNSIFENNTSINGGGSAIYTRSDARISDSQFSSNSAKTLGAVSAGVNYIDGCIFNNNTAGSYAGAVNGNTNYINNTDFISNTAPRGGAVYSYLDTAISGCNFQDNHANRGGAVYSNQGLTVENSNFTDNSAGEYAGAAYANTQITVENTRFEANTVNETGGAIYGNDMDISNSEFIENAALSDGGAIYGRNVNVDNTDFIQNSAGQNGGAISAWSGEVEASNSRFIQNHADSLAGAILTADASISNCEFTQNSADDYGGALYAGNCEVSDSNFTENDARRSGGAIFADDANITNSRFVKNNSTNGGALISERASVSASQFIENTAFDGAAIDCDDLTVDSSLFDGNEAKSFGVIYTVNATIRDSEFKNNQALDGIQVYALNTLDLINTPIPPLEAIQANTTQDFIKNITDDYIIELESGLTGYCTQRTNYWTSGDVYVMDELDILRNQRTGEYIGDYLKILLYQFYENRTDLVYAIWAFTDSDFRNSNNTYVREVLRLYDSGFRVPDKGAAKVLSNGTQIVFDFFSAGKASAQNLFLYNVTYYGDKYSLEVIKLSLNETVQLGEKSYFDILVTNTGDTILHNVRVTEDSYDDLEYASSQNITGVWNHVMENNRHVFVLSELYPNASAMFRIIFNTLSTGVKTNVVVVSSNETNDTNTSNKTTVYKPGLKVEKITLTPIVEVGKITRFEIIVYNTGDIPLNDVSVIEYDFDRLIYRGFASKNGAWQHSIVNGKHVFRLSGPLGVNQSASFIVSFMTTKVGEFKNTVIATSNETDPVTGENTTKVVNKTSKEKPKISKNETNKDKKMPAEPKREMLKAGNPFAVLVLSILLVLTTQIRRRR